MAVLVDAREDVNRVDPAFREIVSPAWETIE
jgi:hypothetical protein